MNTYNSEFYSDMEIASKTSAKEISALLMNRYNPESVVDVGCGTGAFALEFINLGISEVIGYEGDWMRDAATLLEKSRYVFCDITTEIEIKGKFDLCLCLEVGEHLEESSARTLVTNLTSLSKRIAFSAAIPNQGGNHHVNEQWPGYWAELFAERDFYLEWDPRILIWNNSNIASCYRQNLLIYSNVIGGQKVIPPSLVHPDAWTEALKNRKTPLWLSVLYLFPRPLLRFGKKILRYAFRRTR